MVFGIKIYIIVMILIIFFKFGIIEEYIEEVKFREVLRFFFNDIFSCYKNIIINFCCDK